MKTKNLFSAAGVAGSLVLGGFVGSALFGPSGALAQTTTETPDATAPAPDVPNPGAKPGCHHDGRGPGGDGSGGGSSTTPAPAPDPAAAAQA